MAVAEDNVRMPWFSGVSLEGEVAGQYEIEGADNQQEGTGAGTASQLELDGLAPITIFVGANNSGKSRLMRELFQTQQPTKIKLRIKYRDAKGEGKEDNIGSKLQGWIDIIREHEYQYNRGIKDNWILESERKRIEEIVKELGKEIANAAGRRSRTNKLKEIEKDMLACGLNDSIRGFQETRRSYIPILRGMRPLLNAYSQAEENKCTDDPYKQRTLDDYFSDKKTLRGFCDGNDSRHSIFTGLALFKNLRKRLLAPTQTERETVRVYECFLSEHFFPGQPVTLVPAEYSKGNTNNDVVHIKIGDNDDYPVHQLGDGMQSLIICTYPIITETEPGSLFFLEEPDLCMHPSLQRTFLEVLKIYHRKMGHQFFLTTHSNHLLDLLEDNELVSIFSFSEISDRETGADNRSQATGSVESDSSKPAQRFRIRSSGPRDRLALMQLGVRPSATYLANATIWVEGVSDCAYLRAYMKGFLNYLKIRGGEWGQYLEQRLKKYKEDRHYAFVEYSGSNLEHFSFSDPESEDSQAEEEANTVTSAPDICAKAIVIADGDTASKGDRIKRFTDQLKTDLIALPCKEIENLIPESLMKKQILYDHTSPRQGRLNQESLVKINYETYSRSKKGVGAYLGRQIQISKYLDKSSDENSPGTLPPRYKKRWRGDEEGIPALLYKAIKSEAIMQVTGKNLVAKNQVESAKIPQSALLPEYLTQDLIWLCVRLYIHIASCNQDKVAEERLSRLKEFICEAQISSHSRDVISKDSAGIPSKSADNHESVVSSWPIRDPGNRNCLLTAFEL